MFKKNKNIDNEGINEIIYLGRNILKLFYVVLIIGIVLAAVALARLIGLLSLIVTLCKILAPLFIGFVIAWLFSPIVKKMTKKGMPRILASIIVYTVFLIFIVVFVRIFIPVLYEEINELLGTLPSIINKITVFINNLFNKIDITGIDVDGIKENVLMTINNYAANLSESLPNTLVTALSGLVSGIGTIFFGLVIGLYMLF